MHLLTGLLLIASISVGQSAPEPREGNRAFPKRLRGIPVGILVQHHPNPCYPVPEGDGFVWRHDTTVQSLVGDLTLVEYGAYIHTDAGWVLRAALDAESFAKIYRCKDAKLRKGRTYRDPDNARRSPKAFPGDALWFFPAKDVRGRLCKGTALVETEAESPSPGPRA